MAYQDPTPGSTSDGSSTTDVAKEQAGRVGQRATEAGGQVAQTTKEQAQNVVGEAKQQARDLVGEARTQVRSQAGAQRDRAVQGLYTLSDELEQMAQQGGQSGIAAEVARQVSSRTRDVAGYLERHEPTDLLEQVRAYARRRPVAFLATAALAGVVAGRLTKGLAAGSPDSDQRALTTGYSDGYGTSQPLAVGSAEPYGTVAASDYPTTAYETGGSYQTPAYGTTGYATGDEYAPAAGTVGSDYDAAGYPAGQGGAAYPGTPGTAYDPALDPDQPPARGWTP